MPSRKKIVVEMPDGTRKTVTVEMPDEPKTADQEIRERRAPGFDDQTPAQAALAGFQEGAVEGAKGFAKEIVPAVGKGFLNIPQGIFDLVKSATSAGVDLVSDPVGTLTRMAQGAGDLPAHARQALNSTIEMAATDPEGFGQAVADVTGDAAAGVISGRAIPTAARPIAAKAGPAVTSVAERARFPLRISGAATMASGNVPAGAAMMVAPEVAEVVGKKLTQFGNTIPVESRLARAGVPTGATRRTTAQGTVASEVTPTAAARPRVVSEVSRDLSKSLDDIESPARAGLKDLDKNIADEKKAAGAIRINARKAETSARKAEEAADLSQQNQSDLARAAEQAKAQREAAVAARKAEQDAAKKQAAEERFATDVEKNLEKNLRGQRTAADDLEAVDDAIAEERRTAEATRRASDRRETSTRKTEERADLAQTRSEAAKKAAEDESLTPLERELLKRATSVTPVGRGPKVSVTPATRAQAAEDLLDEIDLTDDVTAQAAAPDLRSRAAERFGRNFVDEGRTVPEGRGLPQDLLDEAVEEVAPAPATGLDIPTTRSRRSPVSSVDDRLSENDFDSLRQIIADNPSISTEEAAKLLLDERAARSQMYRTRAGMDRGFQDAFDLDE